MSCKSCKEKKQIREELYESTKFIENKTIVFLVIWSLLGFYGLYSLIIKLL